MTLINRLKHLFSSSLIEPALLHTLQPPLSQEQIAEKNMYAVVTIVECFRNVLQPKLDGWRIKELPGTAFDALELQMRIQEQSGWIQNVVLPGCSQGFITVTEEHAGDFQKILDGPVTDILNSCWIHFLASYDTRNQETPLVGCACPLINHGQRDEIEAACCVPLRIIQPDTLEEIRIIISFSNTLMAYLLQLGLPGCSAMGERFRPEQASLQDGARWVDDNFCHEAAKYLIWPRKIIAQTMLLALNYETEEEV